MFFKELDGLPSDEQSWQSLLTLFKLEEKDVKQLLNCLYVKIEKTKFVKIALDEESKYLRRMKEVEK